MNIPLSALESAFDAIVLADADGVVVGLDAAGQELLGLSAEDASGRTLADVLGTGAPLSRLGGGVGRRVRTQAVRGDGRRFPVEVTLAPLDGRPGQVAALVRVLRDVGRPGSRFEDAWWEYDAATETTAWGRRTYELHGVDPEHFTPTLGSLLELVEEEDQPALSDRLAAMMAGDSSVDQVEYRLVSAAGPRILSSTVVHEQGAADGAVVRLQGVVDDVTAQRLTTAQLRIHEAVAYALHEWREGPTAIGSLLQRLFLAMRYRAGVVWVPEGDTLRCYGFVSERGMELGRFEQLVRSAEPRRGDGTLCGRAWERCEAVAVADIASLGRVGSVAAAEEGIAATVAIPATHRGATLAIFELFAPERRELDDEVLATLTGVGRQLGAFLATHRGLLAPPVLTPREREVLGLATEGLGVAEIAERLFLSPATVKSHFQNTYEKLGVNDRPAAVAVALRTGIIE